MVARFSLVARSSASAREISPSLTMAPAWWNLVHADAILGLPLGSRRAPKGGGDGGRDARDEMESILPTLLSHPREFLLSRIGFHQGREGKGREGPVGWVLFGGEGGGEDHHVDRARAWKTWTCHPRQVLDQAWMEAGGICKDLQMQDASPPVPSVPAVEARQAGSRTNVPF